MYHFRISGPGRHAFVAEVLRRAHRLAARPRISLYYLDPSDGRLHFIAANNDTLNQTPGRTADPICSPIGPVCRP
jgi:hypothetical protein